MDTGQAQLLGRWRAELQGRSAPVLLQLTPHPLLRESVHGKHISANWLGTVQDDSCGKEIRGIWSSDTTPPIRIPFVLRKQAPE